MILFDDNLIINIECSLSLNQAKFVISFTFIMGFQKLFYTALSSINFLPSSHTFAHVNILLTLHQQEVSALN